MKINYRGSCVVSLDRGHIHSLSAGSLDELMVIGGDQPPLEYSYTPIARSFYEAMRRLKDV
ncbi:MAG: hypothetical protein ACU84Q_08460 [Gammaproteobacteria bacterium]